MARILPFTASNFFMAQAGMPPGGQPPGTRSPSGAPSAAVQSQPMDNLRRLVNNLSGATDAVNAHISELETRLAEERTRIDEFVIEREGFQRRIDEAGAERIRLAEGNAVLESSLDGMQVRLAEIMDQLSGAETLSDQMRLSAERAASVVEGAAAILTGLAESLAPIFGKESPVVAQIRQNAGAVTESAASMSAEASTLAGLAETIRSGEAHAVWLNPWLGRKGAPSLLERTKGDAEALSRGMFSALFESLSSIFGSMSAEKVTERLNAFIEAAAFLLDEDGVEGSQAFVMKAISCLISSDTPAWERRGSFHEVIRTAGLMISGRKLDRLSTEMPAVSFLGWRHSGDTFSAEHLNTRSEIDAMEGTTLLELKTLNLTGPAGSYLSQMLNKSGDEKAVIFRSRAEMSTGRLDAGLVVRIANQLARYGRLIDSGFASSIELHLTSKTSIPREFVRAVHNFFGSGRVKIFHYTDALTREAALLVPEPESTPAPSEAPSEIRPFLHEVAPGAERPQAVMQRRGPATKEWLQAAVYQSSILMSEAGHNANLIEMFIDWMMLNEKKTARLASEPEESLQSHLLDQFRLWQAWRSSKKEEEDRPWREVDAVRAQKRFNNIFNSVVGKDVSPDWGQRVTRGVQNTDVLKVLAHLQDQPAVTGDEETGIADSVRDLISYIKENYKPGSYFKFDVDGDALIEIVQRYVWITEENV